MPTKGSFKLKSRAVVGTVISGANSVLISSVAYLDRELLIFSGGPIKYYPNKIKQICLISMQNYITNTLASHISLSISLLPSMQSTQMTIILNMCLFQIVILL